MNHRITMFGSTGLWCYFPPEICRSTVQTQRLLNKVQTANCLSARDKGKPLSEERVWLLDCARVSRQIWASFCPCVSTLAISAWGFTPRPQCSSFIHANHPHVVLLTCFGFYFLIFSSMRKLLFFLYSWNHRKLQFPLVGNFHIRVHIRKFLEFISLFVLFVLLFYN